MKKYLALIALSYTYAPCLNASEERRSTNYPPIIQVAMKNITLEHFDKKLENPTFNIEGYHAFSKIVNHNIKQLKAPHFLNDEQNYSIYLEELREKVANDLFTIFKDEGGDKRKLESFFNKRLWEQILGNPTIISDRERFLALLEVQRGINNEDLTVETFLDTDYKRSAHLDLSTALVAFGAAGTGGLLGLLSQRKKKKEDDPKNSESSP